MMFVRGYKDESIGLWRGRWLNTSGVKREKKVKYFGWRSGREEVGRRGWRGMGQVLAVTKQPALPQR